MFRDARTSGGTFGNIGRIAEHKVEDFIDVIRPIAKAQVDAIFQAQSACIGGSVRHRAAGPIDAQTPRAGPYV
jgi:hypothetical protein